MKSDSPPFGMVMPGRSSSTTAYRFGFNGKENDNEVKGTANQQDYGLRIYDTRLGKFLSVDPLTKKYSFYSPYQFAGDNPIKFIDLDGANLKTIQNRLGSMKKKQSLQLMLLKPWPQGMMPRKIFLV